MKKLTLVSSMILVSLLCACFEPTSTQRQYADFRDQCREYAELKTSSGLIQSRSGEEQKKNLLLSFRDCMQRNGWSVTAPNQEGQTARTDAVDGSPEGEVTVMTTAAPIQPVQGSRQENFTRRAAECAYARQAKEHSSNARAIAKACDIECENTRKLAPDMPTPAACEE